MADEKDSGLSVDDILGPELSAKLTQKSKPEVPAPAVAGAAAPKPPTAAPKPPAAGAKPAVPAPPAATPSKPAPAPSPAKPASLPSSAAAAASVPAKSGVVASPFKPAAAPLAPVVVSPAPKSMPAEPEEPVEKSPAPSAAALAAANAPLADVPMAPVAESAAPAAEAAAAPLPEDDTAVVGRRAAKSGEAESEQPKGRTTDELARDIHKRLPPFPLASVKAAGGDLWRWLSDFPLRHKAIAAGAAAVLVVVTLVAVTAGGPEARWLSEEQTLWSGPASNTFEKVATLERNDSVRALGSEAEYALVRDSVGRVGFILAAYLVSAPLPVTPEQPFGGCTRRIGEADLSLCHGRGNRQLAACQEHCADADKIADCNKLCDARLATCLESCDHVPGQAEPAAQAPPAEAAAAAVAAAPQAAAEPPDGEDDSAGDSAKGAKKKPAKKKPIKKKKKK